MNAIIDLALVLDLYPVFQCSQYNNSAEILFKTCTTVFYYWYLSYFITKGLSLKKEKKRKLLVRNTLDNSGKNVHKFGSIFFRLSSYISLGISIFCFKCTVRCVSIITNCTTKHLKIF